MLQYSRFLTRGTNQVAEEPSSVGKMSLLTIPWSQVQTYFRHISTMPQPLTPHYSPDSVAIISPRSWARCPERGFSIFSPTLSYVICFRKGTLKGWKEFLLFNFTAQMFCGWPSVSWWLSNLYLQPCLRYRIIACICDSLLDLPLNIL